MSDPRLLAQLALIGIALILVGALITPGLLPLDQRAAVLAAIAGVLLLLGLGGRRAEP